MAPCSLCPPASPRRALLRRPKTLQAVCKECFFDVFETEIHHTIMGYGTAEQLDRTRPGQPPPRPGHKSLFTRGERVAIGASGGKDSTVLAYIMTLLNQRYDYGLDLCLLSIDEGISGYRDASLDTVKRNAEQYALPLKILSYSELYGGWTMDRVVSEIGKKGNCTYCGVFRRQALDRGADLLEVDHIVTGHNADDVAETVLMNVLRGDISRVARCTAITTGGDKQPQRDGADDDADRLESLLPRTIKRSKPFKYAYEKEIVMYAYFKKLDYHSTECIYAPTAYRGYARALVKDLEAIRPSAIVDLIYSGEALASSLALPGRRAGGEWDTQALVDAARAQAADAGEDGAAAAAAAAIASALKGKTASRKKTPQVQQSCARCGSMTSQRLCQACMLLEGLNKGAAKVDVQQQAA